MPGHSQALFRSEKAPLFSTAQHKLSKEHTPIDPELRKLILAHLHQAALPPPPSPAHHADAEAWRAPPLHKVSRPRTARPEVWRPHRAMGDFFEPQPPSPRRPGTAEVAALSPRTRPQSARAWVGPAPPPPVDFAALRRRQASRPVSARGAAPPQPFVVGHFERPATTRPATARPVVRTSILITADEEAEPGPPPTLPPPPAADGAWATVRDRMETAGAAAAMGQRRGRRGGAATAVDHMAAMTLAAANFRRHEAAEAEAAAAAEAAIEAAAEAAADLVLEAGGDAEEVEAAAEAARARETLAQKAKAAAAAAARAASPDGSDGGPSTAVARRSSAKFVNAVSRAVAAARREKEEEAEQEAGRGVALDAATLAKLAASTVARTPGQGRKSLAAVVGAAVGREVEKKRRAAAAAAVRPAPLTTQLGALEARLAGESAAAESAAAAAASQESERAAPTPATRTISGGSGRRSPRSTGSGGGRSANSSFRRASHSPASKRGTPSATRAATRTPSAASAASVDVAADDEDGPVRWPAPGNAFDLANAQAAARARSPVRPAAARPSPAPAAASPRSVVVRPAAAQRPGLRSLLERAMHRASAEVDGSPLGDPAVRSGADLARRATLFVETDAFERWLADQSLPERPTGAALAKLREQFRLSAELGARGLKAL